MSIFLGCLYSFGQENRKEFCIGFTVGKSILDTAYGDNASQLSDAVSFIESVKKDSTLELIGVSFFGSASPEGHFSANKELAEKRRNSLEHYIRGRISLPDSIISRSEGSVVWERLAELVETSDMPDREEAVDVLRNIPEFTYDSKGALIDSRKKHLMELQYGRTWHYMYRHFFDKIRNAGVVLVTVRQKPAVCEKAVETPVVLPPADTAAAIKVVRKADTVVSVFPEKAKPFHIAVKTNMLYDALAVPNIGVEFYLGRNWSIVGNWMYAWWKSDRLHRYWRIYGGDAEVRHYFRIGKYTAPMSGHHIGLYAQMLTYDFEWGGRGYLGDRWSYGVGVSYGYTLPVARRLSIDFSFGVGYISGEYKVYDPEDGCYVWKATIQRHWFDPTKAEISLVWQIGRETGDNGRGGAK